MTKVTLHYGLSRKLNDADLDNVARIQSVYGMSRVQVAPSLDKITVDYDASRMSRKDLEAAFARHTIPVDVPIPV